MVEIILQRVPLAHAAVVLERVDRITGKAEDAVYGAIYHAILEEGTTPEEVFNTVMAKPKIIKLNLAPHQFFLAIVTLLEKKFIKAEIRQVGAA